jgi:hypothetical protein
MPAKLQWWSSLHQVRECDRQASRSAGKACPVSEMGRSGVLGAGTWIRLTVVPIWD